tara:strand:- start:196 stop:474 length:279 start_codon:yes stop_codon:yes gene_type:complete
MRRREETAQSMIADAPIVINIVGAFVINYKYLFEVILFLFFIDFNSEHVMSLSPTVVSGGAHPLPFAFFSWPFLLLPLLLLLRPIPIADFSK